jgi:methyl-accepting chemotaxis protein
MSLENLRMGTRLGLGFGAVLLLLVGMAGFGVLRTTRISAFNAQIAEKTERYVLAAKWSASTQLNLTRALALARSGGSASLAASLRPVMKATSDDISRVQKALEADIQDDAGKARLAQIAKLRAEYVAVRDPVLKQLMAGDAGGAARVDAEMVPASDAYLSAITQLEDALLSDMRAAGMHLGEDAQSARALTLAMAALGMAVGGLLSWLITRSIVEPMRRAIAHTQRVAQGDLTFEGQAVDGRSSEIAQLEAALAQMQSALCSTVRRIRAVAESVASSSSQIASGGQDLSGRTEEAAHSLEQTAGSIAQLNDRARQTSDTAQGANELATAASAVAERGGAAVEQVVSTMKNIDEASRRIVDIIGVIDGIAFQTNILALNAAVESARAGEQGRGFAVVAEEVRSLAQRSATAAREIKALIDDSVQKVASGSLQVQEAGQTMSEIVVNVRRVASMIGEISSAARDQQSGIDRVRDAVGQIDEMTQRNAALVEESAAATASLKEQAKTLTDVVREFRLSESPATA